MKQNLIERQGETVKSTIMVGDFNTPPSAALAAETQEEQEEMHRTVSQRDVTDNRGALPSTPAGYTLF